jgi:DNA-binding transcriptional ArsR family regulator
MAPPFLRHRAQKGRRNWTANEGLGALVLRIRREWHQRRLPAFRRVRHRPNLVLNDATAATVRVARLTPATITYSQMAMNRSAALDRTFHALADATRRAMIHALAGGKTRSAGQLGAQFRSAQPTISRHLKVLESARLVERSVEGRVHRFRLRRDALEEAGTWIRRHQAFWMGAVDQLEQLLKETDQ